MLRHLAAIALASQNPATMADDLNALFRVHPVPTT